MSVHCIGNGRVCAYCEGANVLHAFGPSYSSPNAFFLSYGGESRAERLGFGLWKIISGGAESLDFADAAQPVLYRRVISGCPEFHLHNMCSGGFFPVPQQITAGAFMSVTHEGQVVYPYEFANGQPHGYVSAKVRYFGVRCIGGSVSPVSDGLLLSGRGDYIFAFADSPEQLFSLLSSADADGAYKAAARKSDAIKARLDGNLNDDDRQYAEVAYGVYNTIVSQQSASGGVLAGCNYHLCYLRDNYGVFRGLRAVGANEEALRLCEYYIDVFEKYGEIHNAQGPNEYAFHIHENDSVEITGYLVLMLAESGLLSGERQSARKLAEYCLHSQHSQLRRGMLPFNGDETYVAGGILPRCALNDGSLEATALYHRALQRVCEIYKAARIPFPEYFYEDMRQIEQSFRENFFIKGHLVCNHPGLYDIPPAYRHGVRACGHGFGLSFCNKNGDYVCPECVGKELSPCYSDYGKLFDIPAALLCPTYIGSTLISENEAKAAARSILSKIEQTGKSVGYDYGFILYALGDKSIIPKMLSQRDKFGAWSEYYVDGKASGTPCRPWESGVCASALFNRLN